MIFNYYIYFSVIFIVHYSQLEIFDCTSTDYLYDYEYYNGKKYFIEDKDILTFVMQRVMENVIVLNIIRIYIEHISKNKFEQNFNLA